MYLAGLGDARTAIRQYVFWQVVYRARIGSAYYESVQSIADSFGVTYKAAWNILDDFPVVTREGSAGQRKRRWRISGRPSRAGKWARVVSGKMETATAGNSPERGNHDPTSEGTQFPQTGESNSPERGILDSSEQGNPIPPNGGIHREKVLDVREERKVSERRPLASDAPTSSHGTQTSRQEGKEVDKLNGNLDGLLDASSMAVPTGTPTPQVAPPPLPHGRPEGDAPAKARWLFEEFRRQCHVAAPSVRLYPISELDCNVASDLAREFPLAEAQWSSSLSRWAAGVDSKAASSLVIRNFAGWHRKAHRKRGPKWQPEQPAKRAPPGKPMPPCDSIGPTMRNTFAGGASRDAVWQACKTWGVVLSAHWLSQSAGPGEASRAIKDCIDAHVGTDIGRSDVRGVLGATQRWERETGPLGLAMSDWRKELADAISKVGPFKPFPSRGYDREDVAMFVKGMASKKVAVAQGRPSAQAQGAP
jgi:hypothetical protein